MSDFKILAIWPLPGCHKQLRKVLSTEQPYVFYNDYTFNTKGSRVVQIAYKSTIPNDVFQLTTSSPKINISAIVGKNGAGKSSLLELFFAGIYVVSINNGALLPSPESLQRSIVRLKSAAKKRRVLDYKEQLKGLNATLSSIRKIKRYLRLEIFYSLDNVVYSVRIDNSKREKHFIYDKPEKKSGNSRPRPLQQPFVFTKFFYSIVVNYSLYGLNSSDLGYWISSLFHKNDGYKTPLVINPFREDGNIDVNVEQHLAQSRLISNLIDSEGKVGSILEMKTVNQISFTLDRSKLRDFNTISLENVIGQLEKDTRTSRDVIFEKIYLALTGEKTKYATLKKRVQHLDLINQYVIRKLFKIASTYSEYYSFSRTPEKGRPIPRLDLTPILSKLSDDRSHITLKLRQVLNIVRFGILEKDSRSKTYWKNDQIILNIRQLSNRILAAKRRSPRTQIIEFIPVAFFRPEILINNASGNDDSVSLFSRLSSGEQQLIHSLHGIIYHIKNVESVFKGIPRSRFKYRFVNIVLDEIELYFHPEMQQQFIHDLIVLINSCNLDNIKGFNILCSTHSPFILSDLPGANIARLSRGKSLPLSVQERTFATNIHKLLDEDFFIRKGFMGKWSNRYLSKLIDKINSLDVRRISKKQLEEFKEKIEIIGEPYIRTKLMDKISEQEILL